MCSNLHLGSSFAVADALTNCRTRPNSDPQTAVSQTIDDLIHSYEENLQPFQLAKGVPEIGKERSIGVSYLMESGCGDF